MENCAVRNTDYKKEDTVMIITLAQKGDTKALEELLRRIQKDVFSMFNYMTEKREDIADLTQEALLKTAKCISALKNPECFKSWLHHIITNTYFDYKRKHFSDIQPDFNEDKILEIKDKLGCEPGEKCLFSEMDKVIRLALLNLPDNMRIAIILREFEGLSYEDISKLTKTTIGTVKSRISRARIKLQNQLKEFI